MTTENIFTDPLFIIIAVLVLILFLIKLTINLHYFTKELRYLKNEISRTDGKERAHYLRRKRRLWLSLLPFVRY